MVAMLSMPAVAVKSMFHDHAHDEPQELTKRQWFILIIRAIIGSANGMVFFYGLQHLPLADCVVIGASSPIFTVFFARLFLKESIVIADIINVFLVLSGIVMIVKPPFLSGHSYEDSQALYAIIAVIFASICLQSNVFVLIRMLKNVHWSITNTVFGSIGCIQAITLAFIIGHNLCLPQSEMERFYIVLTGLLGFFGQYFMQMAALYEKAANIGLLRKAFDVILAFLFQVFFFKVRAG